VAITAITLIDHGLGVLRVNAWLQQLTGLYHILRDMDVHSGICHLFSLEDTYANRLVRARRPPCGRR
jgi:hypothetical protein